MTPDTPQYTPDVKTDLERLTPQGGCPSLGREPAPPRPTEHYSAHRGYA